MSPFLDFQSPIATLVIALVEAPEAPVPDDDRPLGDDLDDDWVDDDLEDDLEDDDEELDDD